MIPIYPVAFPLLRMEMAYTLPLVGDALCITAMMARYGTKIKADYLKRIAI